MAVVRVGGIGEGFITGAIERRIGRGIVFGEEAIAERNEGALAPGILRIFAAKFVDGALGFRYAVEA